MPVDFPEVLGLDLDAETRCRHWHGPTDIIAIKMKCCGTYYACKDCHEALATHPIVTWPRSEFHTPAILCGACRSQLPIATYLASNSLCPACSAHFNRRCANNYHNYFAIEAVLDELRDATYPKPPPE